VSGTVTVTPPANGVVKIDGTPVAVKSGQLDTSYLTNGQHTVSVETVTPDGTHKTATQVITVHNDLTLWEQLRNRLFAAFHGNKMLMNTVAMGLFVAALAGLAAAAYFMLHQYFLLHTVHTNLR